MCVCVSEERDIKGPLPVRVRLGLGYGLGYQAFCPVFHFLTFCSLAFGLHRGNPRATTSRYIDRYIKFVSKCLGEP